MNDTSRLFVDLLQSLGIIAGFIFTILHVRRSTRLTKFDVFWRIGESHREIWSEVYDNPALERVLQEKLDLSEDQISIQERTFINSVILHVENVYKAHREGFYEIGVHERDDIGELFTRPLFASVWNDVKKYQSDSFRSFLESLRVEAINSASTSGAGEIAN